MRTSPGLQDRQVEKFIGSLLRVGVIVAACVALAGGIWHLVLRGGETPRFDSFRGEPGFLTSVGGVLRGVLSLRSDALIQLGLLLLISVPLVRVAVSIVAFVLERDWLYCIVTTIVLAVLLFSLLGGMA